MTEAEQRGKTWARIQSIEKCDGWKDWLKPLLEEQAHGIATQLLGDLSEDETRRLRVEYRILQEVIGKPGAQRAVIEAQAAQPD